MVFNSVGQYVGTIAPSVALPRDEIEYAAWRRVGPQGTVQSWAQKPSTRHLPSEQEVLDAIR
jgi:hypothetical protein